MCYNRDTRLIRNGRLNIVSNVNAISSNLSASSIIKNTNAKVAKEESANIDTKDTLVKASDKQELKKSDFVRMGAVSDAMEDTPGSVKLFGVAGAAIGGTAAGVAGYKISLNHAKAAIIANDNPPRFGFETPVSVGATTVLSAIGGTAVGAFVGGMTGALLYNAFDWDF